MRVVEEFGGALGQVDDAALGIRSTVIDAHDDGCAVLHVGDARIARQRHRRMRGRQMRHVVDLAVRREPAMEGVAVPGGPADLAVVLVFLGIIPDAADLVGLAHLFAAAAAWQARALVGDPGAGLHTVFALGKILFRPLGIDHALGRRGCAAGDDGGRNGKSQKGRAAHDPTTRPIDHVAAVPRHSDCVHSLRQEAGRIGRPLPSGAVSDPHLRRNCLSAD